MVDFVKRLFASPPQPQAPGFAVADGGAQIVDPLLQFSAERLYAPIRREQRLALYCSMYESMPLAHGATEVLTKLVNTRPVFRSGDAQVDARARQIWNEIRGHEVNETLIRQSLIYGYSVGEAVYPDMRRVERVTVPDSPMMRLRANKNGVITDAIQYAGTIFNPSLDKQSSVVPATKCVILRRDPVSTFDYYGQSLFSSAVDTLIDLSRALKATVSVAMRIGKPRLLVTINGEGLTPEQVKTRLDQAMAAVSRLNRDETTDLGMVTGCDIKVIGHETFTPFEKELWSLKEMVCAAFNLPPLLLNILTTSGQGSESVGRQIVIQLQTLIADHQETVASAWNTSFWPLVAKLEGMPVIPQIEFTYNRLLEQLVEEQGRAAQFAQDSLEVAWGIRQDEWLAQQCGATGIYDPEAFREMKEALRASGMPKQEPNSAETNKNGQTKVTDAQASKRTTG